MLRQPLMQRHPQDIGLLLACRPCPRHDCQKAASLCTKQLTDSNYVVLCGVLRRLYNTLTGSCLATLAGHDGEISKVSFNPQVCNAKPARVASTCFSKGPQCLVTSALPQHPRHDILAHSSIVLCVGHAIADRQQ